VGAGPVGRGRTLSFDSWSEFIAMGNHGFYVWLSYGLSVVVVAWNVLATRAGRRRYLREQADLLLRKSSGKS
jgi:heme exporter protein D